ncbi:uncharacterized protein LDX57_012792 [Aspergillus melleus]|uniref:uncharacterized protein n=1 Tax=Aspergillus melleus TaxID=138277 RepID=UPI001E8E8C16|nr:uncharacterized protein LDX57_012792 [Aspergillus melleus]KAH8435163.1 hypothetical protein LDX57_012792 [Aspergillus melleus]
MRIVDLPVEVLPLVYQSLNDIDDALHLGRACKRLNNVFNNSLPRVNIFRVIIQNQSQHMHDTPSTQMRRISPDLVQMCLTKHYSQTIHMNYPTHNIYLSDWSLWWRTQPRLLGNPSLLQLCDQTLHQVSNQERLLYHRFYQALTAHWLSIESLALAKATVYPTPGSRDHWHTIIYDQWSGRRPLPLREKLDILRVTLFVWEFLARKLFEIIPLVPRLEEFRKRKIFLRPPCLIQALILLEWPDPDSFCDPVGYFDRLTPEYMIQPTVLVGEEQEGAGYLGDERLLIDMLEQI